MKTFLDDSKCLLGIGIDISERVRAEKVLQAQEQLVTTMVNVAPEIIYISGMQTQSNVFSNGGMERLLGYSPKAFRRWAQNFSLA